MADKDDVSKELSPKQDELMIEAIGNVLYQVVLHRTDWEVVLSSLVKRGLISEKRQEVLKTKTQGGAAVAFPALLKQKKRKSLRRGFLLALKESAMSIPSHLNLLTALTKATGVDMKSLKEEHVACAVAPVSAQVSVLTAPSLPPFKYHYPLDDNASAIFTSSGGVLYSPVYGVMVYFPAGAILGEEQVEVTFRVAKEEAEIQDFLSHSLLEGSVLCSGVFEFDTKLVNAPDGEELGTFHSDVWIELPHCLSFRGYSLKDYSTAFVVSKRKGKVELEEQALCSESYPYINLPVRHFSKFCVAYTPKKRFAATPHVKKTMQKQCISNGLDEKHSASPRALSKLLKQVSQEVANSPGAANKRGLYHEMKKVSSEASAEDEHQPLVHQDAFVDDEDAMEVDPPAPLDAVSSAPLQQEPLNVPSVLVMACVCQPVGRDKMESWTAEIAFTPFLPRVFKDLAESKVSMESEIDNVVFCLEQHLQLIRLHSAPSSIQGWRVELSKSEILLQHLTMMTQLLEVGKISSKLFAFLPKSLATVHNMGASLPLHHPVTVEDSWPTARCYLTCPVRRQRSEVGHGSVAERDGVKHKTAQTEVGRTMKPNGPIEHQSHAVQVLDQFRDQFVKVMDANSVVLELLHKNIIDRGDLKAVMAISNTTQQNQYLHLRLKEKCTDESFNTTCDIIIAVEGNPRMTALGNAMKSTLETGPTANSAPVQGAPVEPRPTYSTQGPNLMGSTQAPSPSGSAQDPSHFGSTQGPSYSGSRQGPSHFGSTQGPSHFGSTEGPCLSGSAQDPRPSSSTQGLHPSDSTDGPCLSSSTQGPHPSGSAQGPNPSGSMQGPSPSGSTQSPSPFRSTHGPSTSGSTQSPSPSCSTHGPSPSCSTHGPSPSRSTQGPSLSRSTHDPSPFGSTLTGSTPSSFPSAPFSPQQRATIQWRRDRYVLALLSIMIPAEHLAAFGESLCLPRLTIDQVMSGYTAGSTVSVGEIAYQMFRRALDAEKTLTFGKILVALDEIYRSSDLVPVLRSYVQSFKMATSGTPAERDDSIPSHFLVWLRVNHPHLIPLSGIQEMRIIAPGHSEQDNLFLYLSPKLVCVWRMVGRLLGLTDSDIAAIDAAYNSRWDRESEPCYQMLLKWVKHSRHPSDVTYHRLMAALQLTSLGVGAANDAIFYLNCFVLNLNSAGN